jgi:TonB family protein
MKLSGEHKALLISLGISVCILMLLINVAFIDKTNAVSEFFEVETIVEEAPEELLDETEQDANNTSETNQAFNETQKSIAQAYVVPPAEDFEFESVEEETSETEDNFTETNEVSENKTKKVAAIDKKKVNAYDKANRILEQQKNNTKSNANKNSTVSYSLVNRTANYLPIPVYLCDGGGKIVINIEVNNSGKITNAKVNSSLSSSNGCLQEQALKYAKKASFNSASAAKQLGTITYLFQ